MMMMKQQRAILQSFVFALADGKTSRCRGSVLQSVAHAQTKQEARLQLHDFFGATAARTADYCIYLFGGPKTKAASASLHRHQSNEGRRISGEPYRAFSWGIFSGLKIVEKKHVICK